MSETSGDNGFDPESLEVVDVPIIPDPSKSRDDKRKLFAGDRADDTPRQRAAAAKARTAKAKVTLPAAASKPGYFLEPIQQMYTFLAMGVMPFDPVCANGIILAAPGCAEAWDNLATKNEVVRRMLFSLTQASAVGLMVAAHMPILAAVMMHHVPAMQNIMGSMGAEMAENIAKAMENDKPNE